MSSDRLERWRAQVARMQGAAPEVAKAAEITIKREKTDLGDILVIYRDAEPIGNLRQIGKGKAPDVEFRSSLIEKPVRFPMTSLADISQRDAQRIVDKYIPKAEAGMPDAGLQPSMLPKVLPRGSYGRMPEIILSDIVENKPVIKYGAGIDEWGIKYFNTLAEANQYAQKVANKFKIKAHLLED